MILYTFYTEKCILLQVEQHSRMNASTHTIISCRIIWFDQNSNQWKFHCSDSVKEAAKTVTDTLQKTYLYQGEVHTTCVIGGQILRVRVFDNYTSLSDQEKWDYYGGPLSSLNENFMYSHFFGIKTTSLMYNGDGCCDESGNMYDWIGDPKVYNHRS
jgi:hypothetical protein